MNINLNFFLTKKMKKMKPLILVSWVCAAIALLMVIGGAIDFLGGGGVFGLKHSSTFFTVANTFLLFTIFLRWFNSDMKKI